MYFDITNIENMIKNIPSNLSNLEIARYLYIALGFNKSYDEDFLFGNTSTKKSLYDSKYSINADIDTIIKSHKVICTTCSKLYSFLLTKFGIKNTIVEPATEYDNHYYTVIHTKTNGTILADLQQDLHLIQSFCKTKFFGTNAYSSENYSVLNEQELINIDKKINYINEERDYTDNYLYLLKSAICSVSDTSKKVDFILSNSQQYFNMANMCYVERLKYYKFFLANFLSMNEYKNLKSTNCFIKQENGNKEYFSFLSFHIRNNSYIRYVYSKEENSYIKISDEEIFDLMQNGLKLVPNNRFPSLKKISKDVVKND